MDRFKYSFGLAHHIVVPEPHHAITFRIQPTRSSFIAATVSIVSMLRTIDLNNQAFLQAGKVCNIWSDRDLSSKMTSLYLKPPKITPQYIFGGRGIFPQRFRRFPFEIADRPFAHSPPHPARFFHPPLEGEGRLASRGARCETGWGDGLPTRAPFKMRGCHPTPLAARERPSPSRGG
jgi:hypothetical protein